MWQVWSAVSLSHRRMFALVLSRTTALPRWHSHQCSTRSSSSVASAVQSLSSLALTGSSNLSDGLAVAQAVLQNYSRSDASRFIVIVTNRQSDSITRAVSQANVVKSAYTKISAVAVNLPSSSHGFKELAQVASNPVDVSLLSVTRYSNLSSLLNFLLYSACIVPPGPGKYL